MAHVPLRFAKTLKSLIEILEHAPQNVWYTIWWIMWISHIKIATRRQSKKRDTHYAKQKEWWWRTESNKVACQAQTRVFCQNYLHKSAKYRMISNCKYLTMSSATSTRTHARSPFALNRNKQALRIYFKLNWSINRIDRLKQDEPSPPLLLLKAGNLGPIGYGSVAYNWLICDIYWCWMLKNFSCGINKNTNNNNKSWIVITRWHITDHIQNCS